MKLIIPLAVAALASTLTADAFTQPPQIARISARPFLYTSLSATSDENEPLPEFDDDEAEVKKDNEEADKFLQKAEQLREQIRQMESQIGDDRRARYVEQIVEMIITMTMRMMIHQRRNH